MKKNASELIFISRIMRNGTGVLMIDSEKQKELESHKFMQEYELYHLSITEGTYIAIGFNSYVVKLKSFEK